MGDREKEVGTTKVGTTNEQNTFCIIFKAGIN